MEQTRELRAGPRSALSRYTLTSTFKEHECTSHEHFTLAQEFWL
jgi:hypothetical protein